VFNGRLWEVIALHHEGGKMGMAKLNGKDGTYAANEGLDPVDCRSVEGLTSKRPSNVPTTAPGRARMPTAY
jgi:hypothetical protein